MTATATVPAAQATAATATAVRRLPVPVSEPFPCSSLPGRSVAPPAQETLTLAFRATEAVVTPPPEERWAQARPTRSVDLPDPESTSRALVQAVVEVLSGTRHAGQLVRWLSADVHAALQQRAALAARARRGPSGPGRPAPGGQPQTRRAVVRSVRATSPVDGVVEASAVVLDQGRVRAVALRLEGLDGRWRATALEVG